MRPCCIIQSGHPRLGPRLGVWRGRCNNTSFRGNRGQRGELCDRYRHPALLKAATIERVTRNDGHQYEIKFLYEKIRYGVCYHLLSSEAGLRHGGRGVYIVRLDLVSGVNLTSELRYEHTDMLEALMYSPFHKDRELL